MMMNVMHNRNKNIFVDVIIQVLGGPHGGTVVILDSESSLSRLGKPVEVSTPALGCACEVTAVGAADMDVDLGIRCSRQTEHVKDLCMCVEFFDGVVPNSLSYAAQTWDFLVKGADYLGYGLHKATQEPMHALGFIPDPGEYKWSSFEKDPSKLNLAQSIVTTPGRWSDKLEQEKVSFNENEKKAYEIAKNHLGMSFDLEKSIGFQAWKQKQQSKS